MGKIRKLLRLPHPYSKDQRRLSEAVLSGRLSASASLRDVGRDVEHCLGWSLFDDPDWVEFELAAKEHAMPFKTVADLASLLAAIERDYK